VKKVLKLIGLSGTEFDEFSKRQRKYLSHSYFSLPRISIAEGSKMPPYTLRRVRQYLHDRMKDTLLGDPDIGISVAEMATIGFSFEELVKYYVNDSAFADKQELMKKIKDAFEKSEMVSKAYENEISYPISKALFFLSKINFRFYSHTIGFVPRPEHIGEYCSIKISSYEAQAKYFTHNNVARAAFRAGILNYNEQEPEWLDIPHSCIYQNSKGEQKPYKVYVQPHALVRMKERLNLLERHDIEEQLLVSLRKIIEMNEYIPKHIPCLYMKEEGGHKLPARLGYFPYTMRGNSLYILSFLPLVSAGTPEGDKLMELLKITKEDIIFLGMDKLSFYVSTDFDEIPQLKQALIEADIWHLTQVREIIKKMKELPERRTPNIVKQFFQNMPEEIEEEEEAGRDI